MNRTLTVRIPEGMRDELVEISKEQKAYSTNYLEKRDKDLLVPGTFNSIPIITPRDFWQIARDKSK